MRPSLSVLLMASMGCAAPPPASPPATAAPQVRQAFTQVNLHPDPKARVMYSVNYLQRGLIPLCSQVSILDVTAERMVFVWNKTGVKYEYIFHPQMAEDPDAHLRLYFGPGCQAPPPSKFSELERHGIATGQILRGMSKWAVVLAVGYPPRHATPTLESDRWVYWKNRFDRLAVHFVEGRVAQIRD